MPIKKVIFYRDLIAMIFSPDFVTRVAELFIAIQSTVPPPFLKINFKRDLMKKKNKKNP